MNKNNLVFPIIVQARLSSKRLPNKVLKKINGKPLIKFLFDRIKTIFDPNQILLATSDKKSEDPLIDFCNSQKINFFRGPLNNVAKRMYDAAKNMNAKAFVRISGDSPLIDPSIILKGVGLYKSGSYDLITNIFPRSYPVGQSVEIIRTDSLGNILSNNLTLSEKEHVTKFFYRNHKNFNIKNYNLNTDLSNIRLVVDTPNDFKNIKKIINNMANSHKTLGYKEIIDLI